MSIIEATPSPVNERNIYVFFFTCFLLSLLSEKAYKNCTYYLIRYNANHNY